MAKAGLQDHPKFRRLVYLMGEPVPHVLGYLECLWEVGYQSGNAMIGDSVDIELAAQFPGEKGTLCAALTTCRFIDEIDGKFQIHDLIQHAPEYVKKRARRKTADNVRTTADNGRQCPDNGGRTARNGRHCPAKKRDKRRENRDKEIPPYPLSLKTPAFQAKWSEYVNYRAEQKFPKLGPTGTKSKFKELEPLGEAGAIAAIDHSMANGWAGIFPDKYGVTKTPETTCKVLTDEEIANGVYNPNSGFSGND